MRKDAPILPARFSLNTEALDGVSVRTLPFPNYDAVERFRHDAEEVLRTDGKENYVPADQRQLNNALLACLPTLTHAFEFYGGGTERRGGHQALAVGTLHAPPQTPTPAQMTTLLQTWAADWGRRTEARCGGAYADRIAPLTASLVAAMETPLAGWDWQSVRLAPLLHSPEAEGALGFSAIPSILASLLHGRACTVVSPKGREVSIRWRKAQGAVGKDRPGLFVLSQPFHGEYLDGSGKVREGYFAYRLDFRVANQAGRYAAADGDQLRPWVFVYLSCQRYGHDPLAQENHRRGLSFLVRVKEARLPGHPNDGTLVRLSAEKVSAGAEDSDEAGAAEYRWRARLAEHLANFRAAPLVPPGSLLREPGRYANLSGDPAWDGDEYLLVDATGYEYQVNGKHLHHAVQPGYSLRERAEVIEAVLGLLDGVLIPDEPFAPDRPTPSGRGTPAALRTHHFYRKSTAQSAAQIGRKNVEEGILRATGGRPLHLSLLWREADTRDAALRALRETLFLGDDEPLPAWLTVAEAHLSDEHLRPLPKPQARNGSEIALARDGLFARWRESAVDTADDADTRGDDARRLVLAEIGRVFQPGISPQQSIRGTVRDACASVRAASQMVQPIDPRRKGETEHRFRSAVQDLLLRHTGALLGEPTALFEAAGIPPEVAGSLDLIAFCRRRCNAQSFGRGDIQYVLAVRLRAGGAVEVMLPDRAEWIPYVQAGHEIGRVFARNRNVRFRDNKRPIGDVKLTGGQIAEFVRRVLTGLGNQPTLAMIEARAWRNKGGSETEGAVWPQLSNGRMLPDRDCLDFSHLAAGRRYVRDDAAVAGLLGVIRLRDGDEVPHYIPNRERWDADDQVRGLQYLSGFSDWTAAPLLHYFSAGRTSETAKAQENDAVAELFKVEVGGEQVWGMYGDPAALRIPYRHPAMLEMVPFFVHPDFAERERMTALCRVPHYLRQSPAWALGNLDSPYPIHLGDTLIDDQLCILGIDD